MLEPYFDFSLITTPFLTIFDTGTNNTLDLSGYSTMETVDLNPGSYSSFNGETYNLAIAFNTAIDNFVGGTGGSNVTVNQHADTIYDSGTNNTVNFSGTFANYVVAVQNPGTAIVTNTLTGIKDTLFDVQTLAFADQTISTPLPATIATGYSETITTGQTVAAPVIAGGTLELQAGASVTGNISFVGTGGDLVIDGFNTPTNIITGFTIGDTIVLAQVPYASGDTVTVGTAGIVTIDASGTIYTLNIAGAYVGESDFNIAGDIVLTEVAACFAAGTQILLEDGERPVEQIKPGDRVITENGRAAPVRWVGHRHVDLRHVSEKQDLYLVRIKASAFAANMPRRDLLVTQDHCIFIDGGLIPARMLVNDASIYLDQSIQQFTYYHLELDRHDILLAEGLPTESYLDTGNRGNFANVAVPRLIADFAVNAGHSNWLDDAAAPLVVDRETVEPIWHGLDERAKSLGFGQQKAAVTLTQQPHLRLLLEDGRELNPCSHNASRYMFKIPNGARPTRLLSRASRPSVAIGPYVDDRRMLGVAVEKLVHWSDLDGVDIPASGMALAGWHGAEDGCRWTNGNAALNFPAFTSETFLEVRVAATTSYVVEQSVMAAVAA